MEIAEILGIDEEDLHGFMRVFPNMWDYDKPIFWPEDLLFGIPIREFLQKLTYSVLEAHVKKGIYADSRKLFICPKCGAQYLLRALQVTEDGKVTCQNCDGLFSPIKSES